MTGFWVICVFAAWAFFTIRWEIRDLREERRKEYLERLERKWLDVDDA